MKPDYVLDHTDRERRRLALQAAILNPLTKRFLSSAGVSVGMKVLDLGCGIGEVSLLAAELVGPNGHVHGIDLDDDALGVARQRVKSAGYDHVAFAHADVAEHEPEEQYDVVVGRHILIHTKDPRTVLKSAVAMVREGGLVAFQEYDLSRSIAGYPDMPLIFGIGEQIVEFFRRAVPRPDIGTQLFHLMQDAGLPPPECQAESVMIGGPASPMYEWFAETLISLAPKFQAVGLPPPTHTDGESLTRALREEALRVRGAFLSPMVIGAYARKAQSHSTLVLENPF